MAEISREEKERLRKLGMEYRDKVNAGKEAAYNKLPEKLQEFVKDLRQGRINSELSKKFIKGMKDGTYAKPSEFFAKECKGLFNGFIFKRRYEAFLCIADMRHEWAYSVSWLRRSLRTRNPEVLLTNLYRTLYNFWDHDKYDADICDILERKLPEEQLAYTDHCMYGLSYDEELIAAEIDMGNKRLIALISDMLNGTADVKLSRTVIEGVVRCHNKELHTLLGKLLLAARLEEGLRQNICEACDNGTIEAYITILDVINENDLIRFSSVKRAVGTWLGFVEEETVHIERISAKSAELVTNCIKDRAYREECLNSEDSMKIFIALWSYGVYEAEDLINKAEELSLNGTHHQILAAGYTTQNLDQASFENRIGKRVFRDHSDDHEILAMYLPCLMSNVGNVISSIAGSIGTTYGKVEENEFTVRKTESVTQRYFESKKEAEEIYYLLQGIYSSMKKKEEMFSPCLFPWFSAVLSRSSLLLRMAYIASVLKDNDKIDEIAAHIPEIDDRGRRDTLIVLLTQPETDEQRRYLTAAVNDKETYTRTAANRVIQKVGLTAENYTQLENMLQYKKAEMRSNVIALLMKQDDDELYGTVSRLIGDKKEEKRTAALDMIKLLQKDDDRKALFEKCLPLTAPTERTTAAERILIEGITGTGGEKSEQTVQLYTDSDVYTPVIDKKFVKKSEEVFVRYFPNSCFAKNPLKKLAAGTPDYVTALQKLDDLIEENRNLEYSSWRTGEILTLGSNQYLYTDKNDENGDPQIAFPEMWELFYEKNIGSPELLYRMALSSLAEGDLDEFSKKSGKMIADICGKGFAPRHEYRHSGNLTAICFYLRKKHRIPEDEPFIAAAFMNKLAERDTLAVCYNYTYRDYRTGKNVTDERKITITQYGQCSFILNSITDIDDKLLQDVFPLRYTFDFKEGSGELASYRSEPYRIDKYPKMSVHCYLKAAFKGIMTVPQMYRILCTAEIPGKVYNSRMLRDALDVVSGLYAGLREIDAPVTVRTERWRWRGYANNLQRFMGADDLSALNAEQERLKDFIGKVYNELIDMILATELKRGDTETEYSEFIGNIQRIYGIEKFVLILTALGGMSLERSLYRRDTSKKGTLSHLLGICVPDYVDNAQKLKNALQGTGINEKRLIEAAMYSPEWLDIVGEYLDWNGFKETCWYFIAHMNEYFDDKRKAVIAKYTPLTDEELNGGAFDVNWFRSAYDTLGQKRFDMVYDAAKYISDGSKHSRARKYADAVLGKMNVDDTEKTISDKRNKDLLMAYSLIPLNGEDDICGRYVFLQRFLKESKQFGSQRSASERKAVETAMQNLSINAGYSDTMRLTLRMETKIMDDSKELFEEHAIDDITLKLSVDELGKAEVICTKAGKTLKSIPAKYKKNEYVVRLNDTKKKLTEQYRRTRTMFEQAMEDSTVFTAGEMFVLRGNPVVLPLIRDLVFISGDKCGFISEKGLTGADGKTSKMKDDAEVIIAHPYTLFKNGTWAKFQKILFDKKIVQPFKQVFRELYVKTEEEKNTLHSLRYAGNQIQPQRTAAMLKTRRWVADVEDGLQKVYYKENITARIYAMADWFTPSDIEAPTLEWVEFSDRKTGKALKINDIPDIIFSEVMRDVDMAVSVAHAGGVDPEASHSTVEMRAALLEFTLPLFKVENVTVQKNHAIINGTMGEYTVHLGSGVVHRKDGLMLSILPVHSQHRGKLFLPFADDDPKTAEILTKIIYLAEDNKIKDPGVIAQIQQ